MNKLLFEAGTVDTYSLILRTSAGVAVSPIAGSRDGSTMNYQFSLVGLADDVYQGTVYSSTSKRKAIFSDVVWNGTTIVTLADVLEELAGVSGTGAYAVTLTIDDGDDNALAGVLVRVSEVGGSRSYTATTDADGECAFSLDAATWRVSMTKPLYGFTPADLVVNAATPPQAYSMDPLSIEASANPALCVVAITCIDANGAAEADVSVAAQLVSVPTGSGYAFDGVQATATSDDDGLATLTLVRGATYNFRRGTKRGVEWVERTLPTDQDVVTIANFVGEDA